MNKKAALDPEILQGIQDILTGKVDASFLGPDGIRALGEGFPQLMPAAAAPALAGFGSVAWPLVGFGGGLLAGNAMREPLATATWDANYNPAEPVNMYDRQPGQTTTEYNEYLQSLPQLYDEN